MLPRAMAQKMIRQIARFATVGGLGTITNLIVFFVLVDILGLGPLRGAIISFAVAVSQNYALNELWTFNADGRNRMKTWRYVKFIAFSGLALGVNLAVLQLLVSHLSFPILVIPQALGILAATVLNYVTSRLVTFR
jgi:dolichol-phosphate mannosyltransferase